MRAKGVRRPAASPALPFSLSWAGAPRKCHGSPLAGRPGSAACRCPRRRRSRTTAGRHPPASAQTRTAPRSWAPSTTPPSPFLVWVRITRRRVGREQAPGAGSCAGSARRAPSGKSRGHLRSRGEGRGRSRGAACSAWRELRRRPRTQTSHGAVSGKVGLEEVCTTVGAQAWSSTGICGQHPPLCIGHFPNTGSGSWVWAVCPSLPQSLSASFFSAVSASLLLLGMISTPR